MRRYAMAGGWLVAVATLCAGPASGQQRTPLMPPPGLYQGLTPNSTPPGDALRLGELMALQPMMMTPYAFLSAPLADAIDTSTMITWNEYYNSVIDERNRRYHEEKVAQRAHLRQLRGERMNRLLEDPREEDLMNGYAINKLLYELSKPRIGPSNLRRYGESIPGETIQRISFHYSVKAVVSLGRLTVRDGWPGPLRSADFERERRVYRDAIDAALEQNRRGNLTPEAFQRAQRAVAALQRKLQKVSKEMQKEDYAIARPFLDNLEHAVDGLRHPFVEKVLVGIDKYSGTSIGDLIIFMQRYNLHFAYAITPEERQTYHEVYEAMNKLRDFVLPAAGSPEALRQKEAPAAVDGPGQVLQPPVRVGAPVRPAPPPGPPADPAPRKEGGNRSGKP